MICLGVFLLFPLSYCSAENLIKNPGFEEEYLDTNKPEGWKVGEWSSPVGKVAVELSEDSHSGKYCAKVSSISGNSN
ncbi:MAG: carbohydrate binding domain-containing protein, partial [Candidatus Methanofastidiosia archaeon]